ncbi:MAG: carbohydrate ABC transporter permease [Candidatus Atribacteria bacterium]|jgi:raffinose/stachyose/melibiose transport system permease protein|nr:carbohydrate ABC transporter permease [Candidatus Atribacteria bacterium]MBE3126935.1 carbohydrate ABC transporter permease [Candidatus Atribacteria bacterium]
MIKIKDGLLKSLLSIILIIYAVSIFFPILLMLLTSLKGNREIFTNPYGLPHIFNLDNYIKLIKISNYLVYFKNSIIVAVTSIFLILIISSLASFVIAKYRFIGDRFLYFYFIAGLIIPIKLGTIGILKTMITLHLFDNIASLVIVNVAMGIPFGVFVLTDFIRMIPEELSNSARIDGCSEPKIFYKIIVPLIRPALAAVAIINFIPIWNDFWFPLVLIRSDNMKTIPLATALLYGQYETNFGLIFAVLSMASLPVIIFYLILSRQFIKGLSAGALKG